MKKTKKSETEAYALLIADMLNDFVKKGAPLEVPKAREIIPYIRREIAKARKCPIPIIYCCDTHKENDQEFQLWPKHGIKGTEGAHVIEQLKPNKDDFVVTKTRYSCFYKTPLNALLKKLEIKHIIVTGVATNICILYTVADAYMRDYTVTIPKDCVAARKKGEHKFVLWQIKRIFSH